jgi:hypothetical protein
MATITTLVGRGDLVPIEVQLDTGEMPWRRIYGTPTFIQWLSGVPNLTSDRHLDQTPGQQLDELLHEYITGGPVEYQRQFKPWVRSQNGVWWLKTPDLRIFGWFAQTDTFIAAFGDAKWHVKLHDLVPGFVGQVERVRTLLDLDEPKFLAGKNPEDVLSFLS